MGPTWAYAFLAAGLVTLAGTPLLRRLALATEFVDHPVAAHKSHRDPTPYLGGIGLIVAVLVGLLFTDRLTPQVGVVALGGSLIGCLGLLDDHRSVGALFRFTVELGVAAVAVAAGLRIHATDVPAIDGVLTLVWIVGVTNAVNLLDNMDGLAAGVSAAAATAIFALAVLGEQLVTATVAAGLAGACVGFLVHNKRPASIFMGDTGSLFLGFVLALAAIDVSPALTPPASFAVPLMLLALPVLDTATVTLARLRRGRPVSQGGKDHLSHRLVAVGLSPGAAVAVLVGVEGTVGMAAVMAGRQMVPLGLAVTATVT
ncbi:MAG: glycosyltransferase family 4 protein, partial [Acidimicrobiales bacterium]